MEKHLWINNIEQLNTDWIELKRALAYDNQLSSDLFKETFSGTYAVLYACRNEATVDKKIMKLVINAYNFANVRNIHLEDIPQAAQVLTERMLHACVLSDELQHTTGSCVTVYLLESRQEVCIDFEDVDKSIDALVRALEKQFWMNKTK